MSREADRRIAREFRRRLSGIAPILDLRVFGSRVRGDAAPDSDLDVFIELEEATPELRQRISEIAWEVSLETGIVISTLIYSKQMAGQPIITAIETDGVVI